MRGSILWRLYQTAVIVFAFFLLFKSAPQLGESLVSYDYQQWEALALLGFLLLLAELNYIPAREGDFITASYPFLLVLLIGLGFPTTIWLLWFMAFLIPIISQRENLWGSLTESSLKVVPLYFPNLLFQAVGGKAETFEIRVLYALLVGIVYYVCERVMVGIEVALREGRLFKRNFWISRWEESHLRYLLFLIGAMLLAAAYSTTFQLPYFILMGFYLSLVIYILRSAEMNRLGRRGIFEAFSEIVEGRWMGMQEHGKRVGMLVEEITKILDLPYEERERLILTAILHDIGVVDTPYELLNHPTPKGEQSEEFKHHVIRSAEILEAFPQLKELAYYVRYHHERPDGSGYPEGRKGKEVPFWAYVIGACCDFDDMTCYKSWRERIAPARALRMMEETVGKLYDGRAVALLREAAKRLRRY